MRYQLMTPQELDSYSQATGINMGWPAIIAETDRGDVKGIMATEDRDNAVVAGPIVASSSKVALHLIEKYESVLKMLDISVYLFSINKRLDRWYQAVTKEGRATLIDETENSWWFRRNL